jgi:4-hydroxybenzoate polyprenyltransferase
MAQAGDRFQRIRRRRKLLGLLRLFRLPNLLLIFSGQLLVIWKFPLDQDFFGWMNDSGIWLLLLATQTSAAGGYILNDYHDVKIDQINKPARVVVGRLVTRRKALFSYLLLTTFALAAGLLAGKKEGFMVLSCCALLWLYSARLKCVPLAGNLLVALLVALSLYLPALRFEADFQLLFQFCQFAFLSNLIREIVKDLEDMRGDSQHACRTFPIAFGIPASRRIINTAGILMMVNFHFLMPQLTGTDLLILLLSMIPFGIFFKASKNCNSK